MAAGLGKDAGPEERAGDDTSSAGHGNWSRHDGLSPWGCGTPAVRFAAPQCQAYRVRPRELAAAGPVTLLIATRGDTRYSLAAVLAGVLGPSGNRAAVAPFGIRPDGLRCEPAGSAGESWHWMRLDAAAQPHRPGVEGMAAMRADYRKLFPAGAKAMAELERAVRASHAGTGAAGAGPGPCLPDQRLRATAWRCTVATRGRTASTRRALDTVAAGGKRRSSLRVSGPHWPGARR